MADMTTREKALWMAIANRSDSGGDDVLARAERFVCFLEAHDKQDAAQPPQDNAHVAPGAEQFIKDKDPKAPRKRRTAAEIQAATQAELPLSGSLPMVPAGTGVAAADQLNTAYAGQRDALKELTLDDVRRALTELQTRKSKDAAMAVLGKYAPTKTTGSLPKDKYATLIAECKAAV